MGFRCYFATDHFGPRSAPSCPPKPHQGAQGWCGTIAARRGRPTVGLKCSSGCPCNNRIHISSSRVICLLSKAVSLCDMWCYCTRTTNQTWLEQMIFGCSLVNVACFRCLWYLIWGTFIAKINAGVGGFSLQEGSEVTVIYTAVYQELAGLENRHLSRQNYLTTQELKSWDSSVNFPI